MRHASKLFMLKNQHNKHDDFLVFVKIWPIIWMFLRRLARMAGLVIRDSTCL